MRWAQKEHIFVGDSKGIITSNRANLDESKQRYARDTEAKTLSDVIEGADMFLGLSAAGMLTQDMVKRMAQDPIIFAPANPNPEIPWRRQSGASRCDYRHRSLWLSKPSKQRTVFPVYLPWRAWRRVPQPSTKKWKLPACEPLLPWHMWKPPQKKVKNGGWNQTFWSWIPNPGAVRAKFDFEIAPAVAKAAMDSGVATLPIENMRAYRDKLSEFVYNSAFLMKPIFTRAKQEPKRIVYCEGEDENVLRAVQVVVDEGLAKPILVGRPTIIANQIERLGLRMVAGENYDLVNIESDPTLQRLLAVLLWDEQTQWCDGWIGTSWCSP